MAGSIRKRTWTSRKGEIKTAWLVDYFDQHRVRHKKQFLTKKTADAWLLRARGEVRDGIHTPDSESLTIAAAAELWLEQRARLGREHGTLLGYRRLVRLHLVPLIGTIRLAHSQDGQRVLNGEDAPKADPRPRQSVQLMLN